MVKLDLGCGPNKKGPEWTGVDSRAFAGVDVVCNLAERTARAQEDDAGNRLAPPSFKPWPWEDASVDEVWCSHFLEHLDADERIHFVNELHRVLLPGRSATIITPHWCSSRAYGDLTHRMPVVAEFWYFYLNAEWRAANAPHCDFYTCNFAPTMGYSPHPALAVKSNEYRQWATENLKEACQDLIATLTKG